MTVDIIRHPDRLRQICDFSTFAVRGADIDWEAEITSDIVVRGEWKFGNAPLSAGQLRAARNWVDRMGVTTHAFYLVATHEVPVSQPITAQDLTVKSGIFRLPGMSQAMTVYHDEDHRLAFSTFIGSLVKCYGQFDYCSRKPEISPVWFFDPVLCAAYDSQLAQQKREKNRAELGATLNETPAFFPSALLPDLRTSEHHRRDFLAWTEEKGLPRPEGWCWYQEFGEPRHIAV